LSSRLLLHKEGIVTLEELIDGLSTPCQVLRKRSTLNAQISSIANKLPSESGFFKLDGEPYWLVVDGATKILYYIYVLGKPPYHSMPSERFPVYARALREGATAILGITDIAKADKLVVPEAMGFHVGGVLSAITGKQFVPIAKETGTSKRYADDVTGREVDGRVSIRKSTGYAEAEMFVYGLRRGDRVVVIDTIISTGGTAVAIIKELRSRGIEVLDFASYVSKVDYGGDSRIVEETGIEPRSLVNLSIKRVYDLDRTAYAETTVEKSRWWQQGERTYLRFRKAWESLERQTRDFEISSV